MSRNKVCSKSDLGKLQYHYKQERKSTWWGGFLSILETHRGWLPITFCILCSEFNTHHSPKGDKTLLQTQWTANPQPSSREQHPKLTASILTFLLLLWLSHWQPILTFHNSGGNKIKPWQLEGRMETGDPTTSRANCVLHLPYTSIFSALLKAYFLLLWPSEPLHLWTYFS